MQTELTRTYVVYQGQTRLLELATEIADTKSLNKTKDKQVLATKIRLYLKALQYYTYLEKPAIDRLVYVLADLSDANALPYSPQITTVDPPSLLVGIPGPQGKQGEPGGEGGGVPFSMTGVTSDTVVDSFPFTESRGVEYTINIYDDSGADMRIMRIQGGWSSDGSVYGDDGGIGTTIRGDCSGISMSIDVSGSNVRLIAKVTSGNWTVEGTRKYVPNNGNGITTPTTLAEGKIWVGNASSNPTAVTLSGDVTINSSGVAAIGTGVIVNADISASAAIAVSKLAAMTASRAVVTDASGFLTTVSGVTSTKVGYLSNVTSDIQAQLDSKVDSVDGAISTVVDTNLTANRVLISNPSGKIAVSGVTTTELNILDGATVTTELLNTLTGDFYTPTLTNITNVSASTPSYGPYFRIGKSVHVSLYIFVTPTASTTTTEVGISLPVASNLAALNDLSGIAVIRNHFTAGVVIADTSNNRATLSFRSSNTSQHSIHIQFTYRVI